MSEPMPEPTDRLPGLTLTEGHYPHGGAYLHQINHIDVDPAVLGAVREWTRQQQMRQQLAEREVTDLRAEVERLDAQLATTKTPTVHYHASGRVEVEWTDGRGPVIVQPDVIDAWSVSANALVGQVERLRGLVGEAIDAGASNDGDAIARIRREAGLT